MNACLIGKDHCLTIFGGVYETGALVFPDQARVLEIGYAESDWMTPMLEERPDLHLTGIDWRPPEERPGPVIHGDVLAHDFPDASFDVVVGISSIEHVGLGHYDNDPLDAQGDQHCMERVVRWLKPGGWVYLDVPFSMDGYRECGDEYRVYDWPAVHSRLLPWGVLTLQGVWFCDHDAVRTLRSAPISTPRGWCYAALFATKD